MGLKVTVCLGATEIALLSASGKEVGASYGVRAGLLLYGGLTLSDGSINQSLCIFVYIYLYTITYLCV